TKLSTSSTKAKDTMMAFLSALLIQRWYRQYVARLEMRRRCTWNIFQSIEYAGEQDQIKSEFKLSFLFHEGSLISHLFRENEICWDAEWERYFCYKSIDVPDSYGGPHLTFPLTFCGVSRLVEALKHKQVGISRQIYSLLFFSSCSTLVTFCRDLHGNLEDLLLIFYKNGLPSSDRPYVFNGDFVDRGKSSLEIMLILFGFLLVYPKDVHLNRGNHEDHMVNLRYGFTKEVLGKYKVHGKKILKLMHKIFSWLPLATVIDHKVLIVHGGISDTTDLNTIDEVDRHKYVSVLKPPKKRNTKLNEFSCSSKDLFEQSGGRRRGYSLTYHKPKRIVDILWSDPMSQNGCVSNEVRGGGCYWGPDVTEAVLSKHKLLLLIRSHECKQEGYEFCHNHKVNDHNSLFASKKNTVNSFCFSRC
uniref:Serine/threonine-protein phosphatase n=1 Tax=Periophthalmus magnuspinnatus TaxID=409849 RepID=A0A3B3ZCN1_9GOBI